jgi:hypothetical protein
MAGSLQPFLLAFDFSRGRVTERSSANGNSIPGRLSQRKPSFHNDVAVEAYDVFLTAGTSVSHEVAYTLTQLLWDDAAEIFGRHIVRCALSSSDRMVNQETTLPYYPGAIRFYRKAVSGAKTWMLIGKSC